MKNSLNKLVFTLVLLSCNLTAEASNTLALAQGAQSPKATIEDVAWIAGHWVGQAWGGQTEEVWSPPMANAMMASFKFAKDGEVVFYEFVVIKEENDSLILKLKHFGKDLKGWEEKDETVDFKLVKLADNTAYFDGYTYKLISKNELHAFVIIEDKGKKQEAKFIFKRVAQ